MVFILSVQHSFTQSLKSSRHFNIALPANTADAPAIITITDSLYDNMHLAEAGLERDIFFQAYKGYLYLIGGNKLNNTDVITIADYSQSCNNKRLYVIDVVNMQLLFQTYVSHGKNSGNEFATSFSNQKESNKSSIGFLITGEMYWGNYGTALRLDGAETGINDNVRNRDIVFHGSNYVNEKRIFERGSIARSLGCPAVPKNEIITIINAIRGGSCFFIYNADKSYAKKSKIINANLYGPTIPTSTMDATATTVAKVVKK
jgi:hypothetical protein